MREFKARAWNGHEMWSPLRTEAEMSLRGWRQSDSFVLMLYTGRKDCKGQEIYDRDIVQTICEDAFGVTTVETGTVCWCDLNAGYFIEYNEDRAVRLSVPDQLEVVSNVYETPELGGRA